MTGRTADAFFHVNTVIEVSEIRQVVYTDPFDWFAGAETCAHRFEIRTIRPDLFVAVHAGRSGRQTSGSRRFDGGMTVTAINAVVADVVFVTELDRLLAFDPLPGVP